MKKSILITAAASEAGIAAAEVLSKAGYTVHGADCVDMAAYCRPGYLRTFTKIPLGDAEALLGVVDQVRPDALLPFGLRFTAAVSRWEKEFAQRTGIHAPLYRSFMEANQKSVCMETCRRLGIPAPKRHTEVDEQAILVVKPDWDAGAASGVRYVGRREELAKVVANCQREYGGGEVQEFIPGEPEAMRTLVVVCGREGEVAAGFTMRKTRQLPESGGLTAAAESIWERELLEQMAPLFREWKWRGPLETELKFDRRDGKYKVIEVNPRWPGYVRFLKDCYPRMIEIAARLALGEQVEAEEYPAYRKGVRYGNLSLYVGGLRRRLRADPAGQVREIAGDLPGLGRSALNLAKHPLAAWNRWRDARVEKAVPPPLRE